MAATSSSSSSLGSEGFRRQKCHFSLVKNADFVKKSSKILDIANLLPLAYDYNKNFITTFSPNFHVI